MSQSEPEVLTRDEMKEVFKEVLHEMFLSLGVDPEHPIEMQKDFQHLREWREATNSLKRHGFLTAIAIIVAGALGAVWVGMQRIIH